MDQQKQKAQQSTTTDVGLSADLWAQITDQQKQEAQLSTTTDVGLSTDPWGGFPCAAQGHEEVEDGPAVPEDALKPMCSCILHGSSCFSLPSHTPAHTSVYMGLHISVSSLSCTCTHFCSHGSSLFSLSPFTHLSTHLYIWGLHSLVSLPSHT